VPPRKSLVSWIVSLLCVRQKFKWKNDWNEVTAKKFCRDYVKDKYSIGQLCSQISAVNFDQDIRTCFEDIQVSLALFHLLAFSARRQSSSITVLNPLHAPSLRNNRGARFLSISLPFSFPPFPSSSRPSFPFHVPLSPLFLFPVFSPSSGPFHCPYPTLPLKSSRHRPHKFFAVMPSLPSHGVGAYVVTHFMHCTIAVNVNSWRKQSNTRSAWQSQTWGRPAPQIRVQSTFTLSKFLSQ